MKRLLTALKAVLLATVLIIFTAACNPATMNAKSPAGPNPPGQVQPYQGGINNFNDVDDNRLDIKGADAKAKALKDTVERNINTKRADSVDKYVENYRTGTPLGERTERVGKDIQRSAEDITDNAKDIVGKGSKDLKRNVEDTPDAIRRAADQTKENTKAAGDSVARTAEKAKGKVSGNPIERTGAYLKDKVDQAGQAVNEAADDAVDTTKRVLDKAS